MNKTIKKLALAMTVCATLCGSVMAAPKGNPQPKGRAPAVQKASMHQTVKAPSKAHNPAPCGEVRKAPQPKPPKHEVARNHAHRPEPPKHHEPRHHEPEHHHDTTYHSDDWCTIGASLIGGLIGGLIGSAM